MRAFVFGMLAAVALYYIGPELTLPEGQRSHAVRHPAVPPLRKEAAGSNNYSVVIVGGGAAGLTMAAILQSKRIPYVVLERDVVGASWLNRYNRLCLHTPKALSSLPFWDMPASYPQYVSKTDLAAYLQGYSKLLHVKEHTPVVKTEFHAASQTWTITAGVGNDTTTYTAAVLVVATGQEAKPKAPHYPGEDTFPGPMIHSQYYRDGRDLVGKRVLVVGFGNSGGEIAIDLWEYGADVTILIRSPINIMPRWLMRVLFFLSPVLRRLSPEQLDGSQSLVYSLLYPDLHKYNISLKQAGSVHELTTLHRPPVIDIGALDLIRRGLVDVVKHNISSIASHTVTFADGSRRDFDAIVLATGYDMAHGAHADFLPRGLLPQLWDQYGFVKTAVEKPAQKRLYFVGFDDYLGRIKQMQIDAEHILQDMQEKKYV